MMMMTIRSFCILLTAGLVNGRSVFRIPHAPVSKPIMVRGGAGINGRHVATSVAKTSTAMTIVQGSVEIGSIVPLVTKYGFTTRLTMAKLVEQTGCATLAMGLQWYWTLFRDATITRALGHGMIPYVITSGASLLTRDYKKFGYKKRNDFVILAAASAVLGYSHYTKKAETSPPPFIAKGIGLAVLVAGIVLVINPVESSKAFWGMDNPVKGDEEPNVVRVLGCYIMSNGIYTTALASNIDVLWAYLSSWVPLLVLASALPPTDPRLFTLLKALATIENPLRKMIFSFAKRLLRSLTSIRRRIDRQREVVKEKKKTLSKGGTVSGSKKNDK